MVKLDYNDYSYDKKADLKVNKTQHSVQMFFVFLTYFFQKMYSIFHQRANYCFRSIFLDSFFLLGQIFNGFILATLS